jgi:pyruvate dehydrogenase E1 component alpha subunit
MRPDNRQMLAMYERMVLIRTFEEAARARYLEQELIGALHLYAGEEAIAIGVCAHLTERDYITSTHRGHGHAIAKGVDVDSMVAELLGRATGVCKGKGGSMHIADLDQGMLGANGIVGGGFPLACGAALTAKIRATGGVAVCFFGDGAANQGTFHESLNLAAIWKLPVVFVCENNGFGEYTPVAYHASVTDLATRARAYDIPGVVVDGCDLIAVYVAAGEAIARARRGEGPTLIEAKTYRAYGHTAGDRQPYRTAEEIAATHAARDPLPPIREYLLERQVADEEALEAIHAGAARRIAEAWRQGLAAPFPAPEETLTDVYADAAVRHAAREG